MNHERDNKQKCGKSWIGSFIVSAIDQTLRLKQPDNQKATDGHCVNLIDLIITPLVIEKIPIETLEHLKLEFTQPIKRSGASGQISKDLQKINEVLTAEFGSEVIKRLRLSIVEEKIRTFPH